jgi:hypothetical protein
MMTADFPVNFIRLPLPDDSIAFFQTLKKESEQYWASTDIDKALYGYQIQKNTKWLPGLSEKEIEDFENALNVVFPTALRNFYRTMNGLDKHGVNVYGSEGEVYAYMPIYFSYPADLGIIKGKIAWILESHNLTREKLDRKNIPKIFPVTGHRFLVFDQRLPILSMYGNDIIYWSDNISKLVACNIFDHIENAEDFESSNAAVPVKFWLEHE